MKNKINKEGCIRCMSVLLFVSSFLSIMLYYSFAYSYSENLTKKSENKFGISIFLQNNFLNGHDSQTLKRKTIKIQKNKLPIIFRSIVPELEYDSHSLLVEFWTKTSNNNFSAIEINKKIQGVSLQVNKIFKGKVQVAKVFRALSKNKTILVLLKSNSLTASEMFKIIKKDPKVKAVSYNYRRYLFSIPNDPLFVEQWNLNNVGQSGGIIDADIDAPEAWDITTGSPEVIVAVLDTGIVYTHQDLAANIWQNEAECNGEEGVDDDGNGFVDDCLGFDFAADNEGNNDPDPMDIHGHGTHVTGILGAIGNNNLGIAGINWQIKIMPLKIFRPNLTGYDSDILEAIEYVIRMKLNGINIVAINASWGGYGYDQILKDAIEAAGEAGIIFVAAAGNEHFNNDDYPQYPCSYDSSNIICVGATDKNDQRPDWSNFGYARVDLGAPGVGILSTMNGLGGYIPKTGDFFFDDMESGNNNWEHGGINDSWAITDEENHSPEGRYSWSDSPNGNYLNNTDAWLQLNHDLDLSSYDGDKCLYLGFWIKGRAEYDYDGLYIEFSADGGNTWPLTYYLTGSTEQSWAIINIPIPDSFKTSHFKFRFRFITDGSIVYDGYYIDDIGIGMRDCSKVTVFADDMESGNNNWEHGGINDSWAITDEENHSPEGRYSWSDSPNGNYLNNTDAWLQLNHDLDLSSYDGAYLSFFVKSRLESGYDYLYIKCSGNREDDWNDLGTISGIKDNWYFAYMPIPQQCLTKNFRLKFELLTDGSITYDGIYLDDISIVGIQGSNAYAVWSGTSMATPHVTGAVALVAANYAEENVCRWIGRIFTGIDIKSQLQDLWWTSGRLNIFHALTEDLASPVIRTVSPFQGLSPYTRINIYGCNFGSTPGMVIFTNGTHETQATVEAWSETSIVAKVPMGTGKFVRVLSSYGSSNPVRVSEWYFVSPTNLPRFAATAVSYEDKIYLFGGYDYEGSYLDSCQVYIPSSDSWNVCANMPTARSYADAAQVEGKIFVIGGLSNGYLLSTVETYDPNTNTWEEKSSLPIEIAAAKVVSLNGKIYVIGGFGYDGVLNTLYEYNPQSDFWTQKASMYHSRYLHGAAVLNNKIYVFGGLDYRGNPLDSVEVYDPDNNTWAEISVRMPLPLFAMGSASNGIKAYLVGGHYSVENSVFGAPLYIFGSPTYIEFDPSNNEFHYQKNSIRDLIFQKIFAPLVYSPSQHALFSLSGFMLSSKADEVERLDLFHALNISPIPSNGIVKAPEDGSQINCGIEGEDCSENYDEGTEVTLYAIPNNGYRFSSWTGACSGCSDNPICTIIVNTNVTCSVEFEPNQLPVIDSFSATPTSGYAPLTVNFTCSAHDEDGNITQYQWDFDGDHNPDLITENGEVSYTYNSSGIYQVTCTVTDNDGAAVVSNPIEINVVGTYILLIEPVPEHGTVAAEGITCGSDGSDCSETYEEGMQVTLIATPDSGYQFAGWTGDCAELCDSSSCTILIDSDKTCSALFEKMSTGPMPDLVITRFATPSYWSYGRPARVTLIIENRGEVDITEPFTVSVYANPMVPFYLLDQTTVNGIATGERKLIRFRFEIPDELCYQSTGGIVSHTLHVIVDSEDVILEINEENNEVTKDIIIRRCPVNVK